MQRPQTEYVQDQKCNRYEIIDRNEKMNTTLLQCVKTGDRVRIRSYGWYEIGFVSV